MAGCTLICFLLLMTCSFLQFSAAQTSCRGRCGELFTRGKICTCDAHCLTYGECCTDYEGVCTMRGSCMGRCQETFRRGKECECDPDCTLYNTCCPDYNTHCDTATEMRNAKLTKSEECAAGEVTLIISGGESAPDMVADGARRSTLGSAGDLMPQTPDLLQPAVASHDSDLYLPHPAANTGHHTPGLDSPHPGAYSPRAPLTDVSLSTSGRAGGGPDEVTNLSDLYAGRPSTLRDVAQVGAGNPEALPNESSNTDLCNGSPINGLGAPFNGSIIVFRGHYFWMLDPTNRAAGPARSITAELGVPSPIDTAFTRCNCQGKTYIIKGGEYWIFEKGVMEPGYPRSVSNDFGGLSGEIVAALPVPANRKRPEAIYFFKKDGTVQKLTYPAGSGPNCNGKKAKNSTGKNQPEVQLSREINVSLRWKGFPTPVTSTLSIPNPRKPDGFEHFVFSGPKIFSIRINGDIPTLATPAKPTAEQNDLRSWLGCQ